MNSRVFTDQAHIEGSVISLSSRAGGTLKQVLVHEGDTVTAQTPAALVGDEVVRVLLPSVIIHTDQSIGKVFAPGESIVTMIDPSSLRIVDYIDEDKRLSKIAVGQKALFTVDAFGSKGYEGVVEEITASAKTGDVVFSISDKREVRHFAVKVSYATKNYSELKTACRLASGFTVRLWMKLLLPDGAGSFW